MYDNSSPIDNIVVPVRLDINLNSFETYHFLEGIEKYKKHFNDFMKTKRMSKNLR